MVGKRLGLEGALGAVLLLAACSSAPVHYPTPDAGAPLGAAYDPGTREATFRVWAPAAKAVSVLFFPAWNSGARSASPSLAKDLAGGGDVDQDGWNGVWQGTVAAVPNGQLYQYALDGTPALDPYAKSMARFDSSTQAAGKGAVIDPASIDPEDPVAHAPVGWEPFTAPPGYGKREDAVVYEVHVRDFTIKIAAANLVNPPGTYQAFAERLDHVAALGATHVQLLPVLAYYYGNEGSRAGWKGLRILGPTRRLCQAAGARSPGVYSSLRPRCGKHLSLPSLRY